MKITTTEKRLQVSWISDFWKNLWKWNRMELYTTISQMTRKEFLLFWSCSSWGKQQPCMFTSWKVWLFSQRGHQVRPHPRVVLSSGPVWDRTDALGRGDWLAFYVVSGQLWWQQAWGQEAASLLFLPQGTSGQQTQLSLVSPTCLPPSSVFFFFSEFIQLKLNLSGQFYAFCGVQCQGRSVSPKPLFCGILIIYSFSQCFCLYPWVFFQFLNVSTFPD